MYYTCSITRAVLHGITHVFYKKVTTDLTRINKTHLIRIKFHELKRTHRATMVISDTNQTHYDFFMLSNQ